MGRQPLIGVLLLALGCAETVPRLRPFDGPVASSVLIPGNGPFEEPVGFIANTRNGIIVPVDLKHGILLGDQTAAPFLRPRWIATGASRILTDLSVHAPTDDTVTVYASDLTHNVLIEAPYIVGMNPDPQVITPSHSEPAFDDRDDSGDQPSLSNIELRTAWTTTEDWVIEFDGKAWEVTGSRSGSQPNTVESGDHFRSQNRELEFDIDGDATLGDRFTFSTDTGLIEHDLGGMILAIDPIPGADALLLAVWDPFLESSSVVVWDLDTGSERGRFSLPDGSQAWRFAFGASAAELYIADSHQPQVFQALLDFETPESSEYQTLPTAAPVMDIAYVSDSPDETSPSNLELDTGIFFEESLVNRDYAHLFVGLAGENRVDVYDLFASRWIDVNPLDDISGGIDLRSPVVGLDATPQRTELPQRTDFGARVQKAAVAVSLLDGSLLLLEGDSGCVAQTFEGPHVPISQGIESVGFTDVGSPSTPTLLLDDATGRRVMTSSCGGVVQSERWTVTYDEISGDWGVDGNLSELQENRALEDQRYVSDDGAVSFTLVAGSLPTSDGDNFVFNTDEGILRVENMAQAGSVSTAPPLELPAPPTVFQYLAGPTGGGWDTIDRRTFVLLPVTNSDVVLRVRVKSWTTEAIWN